jgi:serine/threonine protein kinase
VPALDRDSESTPPGLGGSVPAPPISQRATILFVCTDCWRTFSDGSRATCECEKPRPGQGWAAMPHLFRGRYLFVELLGRGGMGAVFRAYDQAAHESPWVAVKVVQQARPELAFTLKEMFRNEVAAAQMLAQHKQFFVQVLGHDGVDPAYLVLEHVSWQTLEQLLSSLPGTVDWLPPMQVARIGSAVLRGVAKMHFHRIVHRDLTPANIFIHRLPEGEGYDVKITDLGLWAFDHVQGESESMTLAGKKPTIDGTPSYMSPEQSTGEPVGAASDIHTLGSVLWEMATGEVPFPARADIPSHEAVEKRVHIMKTLPKRPSGMPEGLYNVLIKALAFDPKKRWPNATEMRRALEAFVNHYNQQRQRDLEVSWKNIDKMSEHVSGLREKLLPMRGLLERLGHLGAVLREVRDHREDAEPDALRVIAENSKRQLEEIRGELNALAAWLEFVAGQTGRTSLRTPQTREEKERAANGGRGVARALPARREEDPTSGLAPAERQPWLERSPWVTLAVAGGVVIAVLLGYLLGRSPDESPAPAAQLTASPEAAPAPVQPAPIAQQQPEQQQQQPQQQQQQEPQAKAAPPPAKAAPTSPNDATPKFVPVTPTPKPTAASKTAKTTSGTGKTASTPTSTAAPKPTGTTSGGRDLIRKNPYE